MRERQSFLPVVNSCNKTFPVTVLQSARGQKQKANRNS